MDVILWVDMIWMLDNGWVLCVLGEWEVGQLDLDFFLVEINLDNVLNIVGVVMLELEWVWVYWVELECCFGECNLLCVLGECCEVDNLIFCVLIFDGDVILVNIGLEIIDMLEGVFEMDFGQFGILGLFVDGIVVLCDFECIDLLQGFVC